MIGTTRSRVSVFMNRFRKLVSSITTADCKSTVRCSTSFSTISPCIVPVRRTICLSRDGVCLALSGSGDGRKQGRPRGGGPAWQRAFRVQKVEQS
jgi:hypothetical protein